MISPLHTNRKLNGIFGIVFANNNSITTTTTTIMNAFIL